jgi:predicted TIM-barrel fold metal-dependent hydrolase
MRIDAQVHVGDLGVRRQSPQALAEYAAACDLDRLIFSNVAAAAAPDGADESETAANMEALRVAAANPRLTPLYWVRPGRMDSHPQAVAGALETEAFAGLLLAPRLSNFALDEARLDRYVEAAARTRKAVFVLVTRDDRSRPMRAYALARRFPTVPFVLMPGATDQVWQDAVEIVSRAVNKDDANLHVVTTHMTALDVRSAAERLGTDRVLFGTDALALGATHAEHARRFIAELRMVLPPEAFESVIGANAAGLLDARRPAARA